MRLEETDPILKALQGAYESGQIELPQEIVVGAFTRIEQILNRFHKVVKQLAKRHGGRKPLTITDEYDVQDLLKALFAIDFEDVRPEEWTPGYAGSSGKRMDFLFKKHGIVVEAKKTRETLKDIVCYTGNGRWVQQVGSANSRMPVTQCRTQDFLS